MDIKKIVNNTCKVAFSLILGGAILYWMYRGFDFKQVEHVLFHKMNWTWMLLSFPFGILAGDGSRLSNPLTSILVPTYASTPSIFPMR